MPNETMELLPCPLCGRPPDTSTNDDETNIYCGNEDCGGVHIRVDSDDTAQHGIEAIARWNRRPATGAPAGAQIGAEGGEVDEISGGMWTAGRDEFVKYAERYHRATKYEETVVIADVAPAQIWRAMRHAELMLGIAALSPGQVKPGDTFADGIEYLRRHVSVFAVEEEEDDIRLRVFGSVVCNHSAQSPEGLSLLKFAAALGRGQP